MGTLGVHLLMDLKGSSSGELDDLEFIRDLMLEATVHAGTTVLHHGFERFKPKGVTGIVIGDKSDLSIHTWPEYGFAAIDVFARGDKATPHKAIEYVLSRFSHTTHTILEIGRGAIEGLHGVRSSAVSR